MKNLLNKYEVAEMLGIKPSTVKKWATAGKLPSIKLDTRTRRYRLEEIEKFIKQREYKLGHI